MREHQPDGNGLFAQLRTLNDPDEIVATLKLTKALALEFGAGAVQAARKQFEDCMLPVLAHNHIGAEPELRRKIWEGGLGQEVANARNSLAKTLAASAGLGPGGAANPERRDLDRELRQRHSREIKRGHLPESIPFREWRRDLPEENLQDAKTCAAWKKVARNAPEETARAIAETLAETLPARSPQNLTRKRIETWLEKHRPTPIGERIFGEEALARRGQNGQNGRNPDPENPRRTRKDNQGEASLKPEGGMRGGIRDGLRAALPGEPSPVKILGANGLGRDFVVGGPAGHFSELVETLKTVKFNPLRDRLLCTGGLWGTGPQNKECASLLSEPWFHSVKGPRELSIQETLRDFLRPPEGGNKPDASTFGPENKNLPPFIKTAAESGKPEEIQRLQSLLQRIEELPLVLKVGEGAQRFHVTHGDMTPKAPKRLEKPETPNPEKLPTPLSDKEIDGLAAGKIALEDPEEFTNPSPKNNPEADNGTPRRVGQTSRTYTAGNPKSTGPGNPNKESWPLAPLGTADRGPKPAINLVEHKTGKGIHWPTGPDPDAMVLFLELKKPEEPEPEAGPKKPAKKPADMDIPDPMNPLPVTKKKKKGPDGKELPEAPAGVLPGPFSLFF